MSLIIKSKLIDNSPKSFRTKGKLHYHIRIFVDSTRDEIEKIKYVRYQLHPSFKDRIRTSVTASNNFAIDVWTYGFFEVVADVYYLDGHVEEITGDVKW